MDSPVNFIVYSHQRSGTTFFCNDVLSSHNEVFCFDELYNQRGHQPTIDVDASALKMPQILEW